jgi:hypothetical protein
VRYSIDLDENGQRSMWAVCERHVQTFPDLYESLEWRASGVPPWSTADGAGSDTPLVQDDEVVGFRIWYPSAEDERPVLIDPETLGVWRERTLAEAPPREVVVAANARTAVPSYAKLRSETSFEEWGYTLHGATALGGTMVKDGGRCALSWSAGRDDR